VRIVARIIVVLLAVLVAITAGSMLASESGEVVVLHTIDAAGAPHETRLWVVDDAGRPWLRAGSADSGWFAQLRDRPDVRILRNGQTLQVRAVPEVAARGRINDLMSEKYGWADAYIGFFFGREDAVPIRLEAPPG
jgi:hypothetical protein